MTADLNFTYIEVIILNEAVEIKLTVVSINQCYVLVFIA
jgi:hypothetical protein